MSRCLQLANLGEIAVAPNPMVGCVIVHNKQIVAEGYHRQFGAAHAEVNAFNNLPSHIPMHECEVYVSLEPCSHFGKTPPCADLIINKNPKKVIVGMLDPNPQVAGSGIQKIVDAGIAVETGILEDECKLLNKKFVCFHSKKRPFVTLKWAQTADGFIGRDANDKLNSKQISSKRNRPFIHKLRAEHTAILIGANTLFLDNPKLDVRYWKGNNPLKIILSKSLHINLNISTLTQEKTLIINEKKQGEVGNITFLQLSDFSILSILNKLYEVGVHSILVEGGSNVLKQFIDSDCWDEAIVLTSNAHWKNGITAPTINKNPEWQETFNDDNITFFVN